MGVDNSEMIKTLEAFPMQCREALSLPKGMYLQEDVNSIVVVGMGGSAIAGDLLKAYLHDSALPVHVVRGSSLPGFVNKHTLVLALSYSGNTEETLRATKQALDKEAVVVGLSSGGQLQQMCKRHILLPEGYQPRCALAYLFFPLLGLLHNSQLLILKNADLNEMLQILSQVDSFKERAKQLVKAIKLKTPIVYASAELAAVAMRWKTQLNENAKTPAFFNQFSEMNHNEIVGYQNMRRADFISLVLRDKEDDKKMSKRMDVTHDAMSQTVEVEEVYVKGTCLLSKLISTAYLGDFVSYYLALDKRVDPTPVDVIEDLKKKIA